MVYQINGTTVINQSRLLQNLIGYETSVVTLAGQSGSTTTSLDMNSGSCFVVTCTTNGSSTKTLSITNVPPGQTEATVFIQNTASGTPGPLTFTCSGYTIRTSSGTTFTKPSQNQLDAYSLWFWNIGADLFITHSMRNIS